MWHELGLDLEAHQGLLDTLGRAYSDIYLAQHNRPQGMDYFNFVMSEIHGLRIRELLEVKRSGGIVVGTFCTFVPEEIILAAGGVCVGLCAGADVAAQQAEQLLPRNCCALIKSFVGFKLAKICPYVEACNLVIGETTCDGKKKAYEIFGTLKETFVLETPHMKSAGSRTLWRGEIDRLVTKIEETSGRTISAESLRESVAVVNAKRKALHRLSAIRAADPPPISGLDALLINQIQFYDDPRRFTEKLNALCDELEDRVARQVGVAAAGGPRILVSGCPMPAANWKVPMLIEQSGAVIVGEESCVGERGTRNLVREEGASRGEILERIADRYLEIDCAVFTPNPQRLEHIVEMARRYHAAGVVHYVIQFCTPYMIETQQVDQALRREGIPLLRLETDYSMEDVPQLETRIQAFLELLKQ
jgi:benzoyl-CoA reductase/2-hydroxyglutaryl-CoA dehydratase subunit BcrC/BadD/HgdB